MAGRPRKIAAEYADMTTAEAIRRAAEQLCGEKGLSGLKLREIARRVGIEPASIYNHYKGLDDVLAAVVSEALGEVEAFLKPPPDVTGAEAIRYLCQRETAFMARRKGIARLMLSDFAEVHDANAFDVNEAQIVRLFDLEAAFLTRHLGLGHLSRQKLGQIALSRLSMTIMLLASEWLNGREADAAKVDEIAGLVAAFLLGLPRQLDT